jgi:hypothetical protein
MTVASRPDWAAGLSIGGAGGANNIVTGVVPVTAVAGLPVGAAAVSGSQLSHVTVTIATGPATIQFAHGLLYTPTMIWVWPRGAEGVTPTIEVGACYADTNSGNVAICVSAAGTFDVFYC